MPGTWAVGRGDCRKKNAEKLAERNAHRGDSPSLDDQEKRPAVKKSPERAERLAQVDVLPTGLGHHGGELAVAERGDYGENGRDDPSTKEKCRRVGATRDIGVDDEDARTDHRPDDKRGGTEQSEALDHPHGAGLGCVGRGRVRRTSRLGELSQV